MNDNKKCKSDIWPDRQAGSKDSESSRLRVVVATDCQNHSASSTATTKHNSLSKGSRDPLRIPPLPPVSNLVRKAYYDITDEHFPKYHGKSPASRQPLRLM